MADAKQSDDLPSKPNYASRYAPSPGFQRQSIEPRSGHDAPDGEGRSGPERIDIARAFCLAEHADVEQNVSWQRMNDLHKLLKLRRL
ncbi:MULTISPECIES: hypothetical protein [unclassified Novosphingobium]|uniref:hypothetical protein n=1 Tax=unclassified Novosphingobium TaxID=2644732 RepID=UPI00146A8F39|nr:MULTISPECIES: hypothetical protein [unclassified Novosphingobium]NMN06715.1 hypothetical protein [Novosphingobium sp. SG919]NMN88834.1 hypothetical protein [Novosphingobium sp. SG916]